MIVLKIRTRNQQVYGESKTKTKAHCTNVKIYPEWSTTIFPLHIMNTTVLYCWMSWVPNCRTSPYRQEQQYNYWYVSLTVIHELKRERKAQVLKWFNILTCLSEGYQNRQIQILPKRYWFFLVNNILRAYYLWSRDSKALNINVILRWISKLMTPRIPLNFGSFMIVWDTSIRGLISI